MGVSSQDVRTIHHVPSYLRPINHPPLEQIFKKISRHINHPLSERKHSPRVLSVLFEQLQYLILLYNYVVQPWKYSVGSIDIVKLVISLASKIPFKTKCSNTSLFCIHSISSAQHFRRRPSSWHWHFRCLLCRLEIKQSNMVQMRKSQDR